MKIDVSPCAEVVVVVVKSSCPRLDVRKQYHCCPMPHDSAMLEPRTVLLNCGAACAEVVVFVAIFTLLRCLVLLFPVFPLRRVVDVLVSVTATPAPVPSGPANVPLPATLTKVSTDDMV